MSHLKQYNISEDVLQAARKRISYSFDNFEKLYIAYSGGKDSTVMLHLVLEEAIKRGRRVGVLFIDLEAQYTLTIQHSERLFKQYAENIELFWICLPLALRNSVSNFEPRWKCWDPKLKDLWVRKLPQGEGVISDPLKLPFFIEGMEFEEFIVEFGAWYAQDSMTGGFIGIRTDESLNRFRTIASKNKKRFKENSWTTLVIEGVYNIYPIYDWRVSDLWHFHALNKDYIYNPIYEYMFKAGLTPAQMRLCQPYGDDQKQGLWLYHILEPQTWPRIVNRVIGANSGSLYIQESGSISGNRFITKPENHTWESYCHLLLKTLPKKTAQHYLSKFNIFLNWWRRRGYPEMPQEAPAVLEAKRVAPSWRRLCRTLLRNDYWCKGLGFSQPKSEAYGKYLQIKKRKKALGLL